MLTIDFSLSSTINSVVVLIYFKILNYLTIFGVHFVYYKLLYYYENIKIIKKKTVAQGGIALLKKYALEYNRKYSFGKIFNHALLDHFEEILVFLLFIYYQTVIVSE